MEVDNAAQLVLAHFDVLHPHQPPRLRLGDAEMGGEAAAQSDAEPAPQFRRPPLPHHLRPVVVAVQAQRRTDRRVVGLVTGHAPGRPAVRAQGFDRPGPAPGRPAPARAFVRMHEPEARRGEGGEHLRMSDDGLGYALVTTGGSGPDQVPHVALVLP